MNLNSRISENQCSSHCFEAAPASNLPALPASQASVQMSNISVIQDMPLATFL